MKEALSSNFLFVVSYKFKVESNAVIFFDINFFERNQEIT